MVDPNWNELWFNVIRFDIPKVLTGVLMGVAGKSIPDGLYRRKRVQEIVAREIRKQLDDTN